MTSSAALLTILLSLAGRPALRAADEPAAFKIVVNAANPGNAAKRETVADIFLRKASRWRDGATAAPVDQSLTSKLRATFCAQVLHQTTAAVQNYWQRQIFSGRDHPPPVRPSDPEVLAYVQSRPGGIGYVSESAILPFGVKELKLVD